MLLMLLNRIKHVAAVALPGTSYSPFSISRRINNADLHFHYSS